MTQTMIVVNSDNHAMKTGIIKTTTTKIKLPKISVGVDHCINLAFTSATTSGESLYVRPRPCICGQDTLQIISE